MKKIDFLTFIFILITFIYGCKKDDTFSEKSFELEKQPSCEIMEFNPSDSIGNFTGRIIKFKDVTPRTVYRILYISDLRGDTIVFRELNGKIENLDEEKTTYGKCITITYKTEIIMSENDVELNRFYYALSVSYP